MASLIIEVADPEVANRMIDEGIVTGAQMHSCTRYNPDCRMKQCFKCLQYGHKATKCSKGVTCNKCSGQHLANKCVNLALRCAVCQGPHGSFDKNCPLRIKEIDKIKAAQMATPRYHKTDTRIKPAGECDGIEFPTPAETTRPIASSSKTSTKNSLILPGTKDRSVDPRTNVSTKRKHGTPLAIFEETEKAPQPNTTFRREDKRKDDRERSRLPARTDRKKNEPRSVQATQNVLGTHSPSQSNSRPLRERRKTLRARELDDQNQQMNIEEEIFLDALPCQC